MGTSEFEDVKPPPGAYHKLVCGSLEFNNDSAVVLPGSLLALSEALRHVKEQKDKGEEQTLLILSHTDAVGDPAANQKLSQQRAESVLYAIMGKPGGQPANSTPWGAVCRSRFVSLDVQMILAWSRTFGWSRCDPGPLLTDKGADKTAMPTALKTALFWFKASYKHEYKNGEPPPAEADAAAVAAQTVDSDFWRAVFHLYCIDLSRKLRMPQLKLEKLCESVKYFGAEPSARSVGCGEKYPIEKTQGSSQKNRRTEFMFFPDGSEPPAAAKYGDLYKPGMFTVTDIPCHEDEIPIEVDVDAKDVVFIIDRSGSMVALDGRTPPTPDRQRLGMCKAALCAAIDRLAQGHTTATPRRFNVISFSTAATWWKKASGNSPYVPLVPCTGAAVGEAKTYINALTAEGSTQTDEALEWAFKARGATTSEILRNVRIVLFSDGYPSLAAGEDLGTIYTKVSGWQQGRGWRIDTYGFVFGNGGARFAGFMERLASLNSGLFTPV